MNHVVLIAYVPDTETKIKIASDGKSIEESDVKWIVSPYDEFALEEAIKTKETKGGTVTVVTYGPARADVGLRECLARGADEAVRIASEGVGEMDSFGVAQVLAAAVKTLPHDVVWMGNKGVGTDAQVLVWTDMAGLTPGPGPKFLKRYADLRTVLTDAVTAYTDDVREGRYPAAEHGYS